MGDLMELSSDFLVKEHERLRSTLERALEGENLENLFVLLEIERELTLREAI